MPIVIDQMSEDPIYQQIRTQVIGAIATGELSPGEPLPSVRSLARVLRDEGYLIMRGRSGAFVADIRDSPVHHLTAEQDWLMGKELRRLAVAFRARGGSESAFVEEAARQARAAFQTEKTLVKGAGTDER